ncbi:MAG: TIGR02117 family protein [Weeksellaceae bacterium]|nr:TIGR02117 family protein [Weeksellaceae bacterium]
MKSILRTVMKILLGILIATGIYFLADSILSSIPHHSATQEQQVQNITIYLQTNGVHTDLVLPKKTHVKDWEHFFSQSIDAQQLQASRYIAFGWGDRAFYMNTPEWSDLTPGTAISAALGLGPSAMHVSLRPLVQADERSVAISISDHDYRLLIRFITDSFQLDEQHFPRKIHEQHPYPSTSTFFEAHRRYNLFYTCNTWTNQALKTANQKAALWTSLDTGIFKHYQ